MIKLELPIYWEQTSSKTTLVGMNAYRNWHHFTSNNFKREFTELVVNQLGSEVITGPFRLIIDIYYKNPSCDGSNISALIEKVALDALQSHGTITNDNVKFHLGTTWNIITQDRLRPRAEVTLLEEPI